MQISTRFPVAIHVLLGIEILKEYGKVTSEAIAKSVNTNPVVIRKIMGLLREAGLIEIAAGTGGARLLREPERISLLDVYRATETVKSEHLFKIHEDMPPACPVGGNIEELLAGYFADAQAAMESKLGEVSLADLLRHLERIRRRKRGRGAKR